MIWHEKFYRDTPYYPLYIVFFFLDIQDVLIYEFFLYSQEIQQIILFLIFKTAGELTFQFHKSNHWKGGNVAEMKIGYSGNYPYVEINFSLNEGGDNYSIKLPMSKMWYKDIIYEIEKVAEEEKKNAEKYLHEDNREMMTQSFDMYAKLVEIGKELRGDIEKDSEGVKLSVASGGL